MTPATGATGKERVDIIDRVRAVSALSRSTWGTPENEMFAFLSVFHPEIPLQKRIEMCRKTGGAHAE